MENDDSAENRIATVRMVTDSPPVVHPEAPGGVWRTTRECYELMANHVGLGSRTLETGAGLSTALFAAWGSVIIWPLFPLPERQRPSRRTAPRRASVLTHLPSIFDLQKWRSLIGQIPVSLTLCSSTDATVSP